MEAKLGGLKLGGRVNDSEGRFTETHNADGTTDTTGVRPLRRRRRRGHDQEGRGRQRRRHAHPLAAARGRRRLAGRAASTRLTGKTPPSDPGGNVRLDFTEGQLEQLRQAALSRLADKIEMNRDGRPTNDEIAKSLQREPRRRRVQGRQYGFTGLDVFLGMAETPEDALIALYHGGMSSGAVAENL